MQNDIAKDVSDRLGTQLSAEDQKKLAKGSTANAEAYQLYLKGKYSTTKFTKDGFDAASNYFNQAIAIDPNYGRAYSGLAFNYINQDDWYLPPNESAPAAKAAAEKALAIDDSDGLAHLALALEIEWFEWDQAAAGKQFERAVQLGPDESDTHQYYAWYLAVNGQMERAAAEARRSTQANPLSGQATTTVGIISLFSRHWDTSIEELRSAKSLDPAYWFNACFLGRAYEATGRSAEALAEFQHGLEVDKENPELLGNLGHLYAITGKKVEAEKVIIQLKELSDRRWVAPYNTAIIYVGMGEKDQAFAWLERSFKDRSYYLEQYLPTDSRLDVLKGDSRFADLWKRVGLPGSAR